MVDKIYCEDCKYCRGRDCHHPENTKDQWLEGNAYSRARKLDWISVREVNRKNDCKLFKRRLIKIEDSSLLAMVLVGAVVIVGVVICTK